MRRRCRRRRELMSRRAQWTDQFKTPAIARPLRDCHARAQISFPLPNRYRGLASGSWLQRSTKNILLMKSYIKLKFIEILEEKLVITMKMVEAHGDCWILNFSAKLCNRSPGKLRPRLPDYVRKQSKPSHWGKLVWKITWLNGYDPIITASFTTFFISKQICITMKPCRRYSQSTIKRRLL